MRQHLNPVAQVTYDLHYNNALKGGCDVGQAHSIAREKTLQSVMRETSARHAQREKIQDYRE